MHFRTHVQKRLVKSLPELKILRHVKRSKRVAMTNRAKTNNALLTKPSGIADSAIGPDITQIIRLVGIRRGYVHHLSRHKENPKWRRKQ